MMSTQATHSLANSIITTTTLVPFLYQTRTIYHLKWPQRRWHDSRALSNRRKFTSASARRYAGNSDSTRPSDSATTITTWSPLEAASEPTAAGSSFAELDYSGAEVKGENTTSDTPTASSDIATWSSLISTREPDHARSQQLPSRPPIVNNSAPNYRGRIDAATRIRDYTREVDNEGDFEQALESIDFDDDMDGGSFSNKDEIAELTRSQPLGESTITDSERYAFQKVFRDIFGKSQSTGIGMNDAFDSLLPLDAEASGSKLDKVPNTPAGGLKMSRFKMEEMVSRYPAPLRPAAARAIGLTEVEVESDEDIQEAEPELDMERLETIREPERKRVETLMKDAKTDFELWDIMGKEVFSLIPRLGLEDVAKPEQSKKLKSKSKKSKSTKGGVETSEPASVESAPLQTFSVNDDGISPLALYGPLYPSYLLLGLRLLDRSFAKSSSLTLALLPKIKSLGLISHVLGASGQLYNELLQIHRYRHDDYRGILSLLGEMENSGIEFDKETLEIVKDIQRTQLSVRKGEKGAAIQTLWNLPEFAPNRFKVWYDKIGGDINTRELTRRTTLRY